MGLPGYNSFSRIIAGTKLDSTIKKDQEIVTLAIAKHECVGHLLSIKAMLDNRLSAESFSKFDLIFIV